MTDESVFAAALAIGSPSERAAYLDRVCSDNPKLRREVEELLRAHAADNPLDRPPVDLARTGAYEPKDGPAAASVGDRIGPFRLMEQIGEGGFGLVFVAEQSAPVRRKVALKVLKPGMDTREVVARFEAERQALALMDHPNIAKVLDAGATEQGRPFFAMELVRGVPITDFCDQHKLSPRERLALFVQVCHAVQHAHQKGVIHRDIKPSNILVTSHDGVPVPKVIDFGVAKAVGQSLTDKTIYTRFAQMIGTPLYMSPEQAELSGLDVDTRTDVYALGVLLYELLTGTTPFDRARFRTAAFDEIRRIIREEEPPRPSTRLTSLGATLTAVSASRGTDPGKLAGLVRGELDWIVMKCLEKDRNRRYETANALAKDIERHLAGDAVEACPPTLRYRLRKCCDRNKVAIVIAFAFAVTLLTSSLLSLLQMSRAAKAELIAEWQRDEAEAALERLTAEEQKVRALLAESEGHRRDTEVRLLSATIDLDLRFNGTDTPLGLVRLAQTLKTIPPEARELREFAAMALIARGQELAPLLPFRFGAEVPAKLELTPDGRTALTHGGTSRLWESNTGRLLKTLREGDERTEATVLSENGAVACTVSSDGVARFWDVPSGRLRARTGPLPPGLVRLSRVYGDWDTHRFFLSRDGRRLVSVVMVEDEKPWEVAVWDTATGRRLIRLRHPGVAPIPDDVWVAPPVVALSPDGRQLVTAAWDAAPIRVWSVEDGALLHTLPHEEWKYVRAIAFSPSGRRAAAVNNRDVVFWETTRWQVEATVAGAISEFVDRLRGVTESVFVATYEAPSWGDGVQYSSGVRGPECDLRVLTLPDSTSAAAVRIDGDVVTVGATYDFLGPKKFPPAGRRFHPEFARFAVARRWLIVDAGIVDLVADKQIDTSWDDYPKGFAVHVPGIGFAIARDDSVDWIPQPSRLPPDDLLVLWAGVVARGELSQNGEFVRWNEKQWEEKRKELAARAVPHPDFPFPGRVATNQLYWLRREFEITYAPSEPIRSAELVRKLIRRAEEIGDANAVASWQAELETLLSAVAPPPREVNR